ncbi:Tho complex subunit 7-domain-containing protein [Neurospora hispaniola]|uniref:Tho complex subunit 7-domain-containing protein n=1 Tax=Neurospora hispaniola TaxID=588809 RepID=A0AAJ0IC09_9PEZI|nr:Tho complex subunit 7-domain-containing protein [Neurospora hispaniola]
MASWGLLDDKEENELHKSRLLNVEEKPFKRVTKRLSTLHSLTLSRARQAPTPPPEGNSATAGTTEQEVQTPTVTGDSATSDLAQLKEDIILDFAAFDSSIARLQFLLTANERERERYVAERERILNTAQAVRNNTVQLRVQLEQARATLEERKKFDELADKITNNPALRTRAEQAANLRKLEEEIAELKTESETYGITWHERRDQFAKIMDESMRLRRLIRDEKEEVERREGMGDDEGGAGDTEADAGQTPRPGISSGNATPRPDSGLPTKSGVESGDAAGTPHPVSTLGARTPARDTPAPGDENQSFLKPPHDVSGGYSQTTSQEASREGSVNRGDGNEATQGTDVEMTEVKEDEEEVEEPDSPLSPLPDQTPPRPRITVDGPNADEDTMDTT